MRPRPAVREIVGREISALYRKLLVFARDNEESRRFMTVPGIGPITAVARKLAVSLHRMWRDGTDFICSAREEATA